MRQPPVRFAILICVAVSLATLLRLSIGTTREIRVSPTAIDFGEVEPSIDTNRRLTFHNPSPSPVLVRVDAECDCVSLSQSELKIPSRGEATIDVTLNRMTGDRREQWYTFLESELKVAVVADGEYQDQLIPIKAQFFEPYAVDDKSVSVNGLATDLKRLPIRFSAATGETRRPTISKIPSFVESVEVDWNEEFTAGELLVTIKLDASPGLHQGHIEMSPGTLAETLPRSYLLPFEARVQAPYRFNPGMALLGGVLDGDSEIVELEDITGPRCSIVSLSCDSNMIEVEKQGRTTFLVRRTDTVIPESKDSPVIYISLEIGYEAYGIPLTVKDHFPVYVSTSKQGDF